MSVQKQLKQFRPGRLASVTAMVVSAWAMSVSANSTEIDSFEFDDFLRSEKSEAGVQARSQAYRPLVKAARLFRGAAGLSLDMDMSCELSSVSSGSNSLSIASISNDGVLYSMDSIPEYESIGHVSLSSSGTRIYRLKVMKAQMSFKASGEVSHAQLPGSSAPLDNAHLGGALETALKSFADSHGQLLRRIPKRSLAVVLSRGDLVELTIYSSVDVTPFVTVRLNEQGESTVTVHDQNLAGAEVVTRADETQTLRVVGVLETYEGSVSEIVGGYLREVADGVTYDDMRAKMLTVGDLGIPAWQAGYRYNKGPGKRTRETVVKAKNIPAATESEVTYKSGRYVASVNMGDGQIDLVLQGCRTGVDVADAILHHLKSLNYEAGHSGIQIDKHLVRFAVPDPLFYRIQEVWSSSDVDSVLYEHMNDEIFKVSGGLKLKDMVKMKRIIRDSDSVKSGQVRYKAETNSWLAHYLKNSVYAFFQSGFFNAAIGAGLRSYDRYQQDGVMPYQYSEKELLNEMDHVADDVVRGGVAGLATFNVMAVGRGRIPGFAASAVVGMGSSLYDSYQSGNLSAENVPVVAGRAGLESMAAGAGAFVGGGLASYVPLPFTRAAGTLVGSLAGMYTYKYTMSTLVGSLAGMYTYKYTMSQYAHKFPASIQPLVN